MIGVIVSCCRQTNISSTRRINPAAAAGDKDQAMPGIHHVTAISGKAERNLEFYTRVLGMRFVKKTVNFDDPGTSHLYYGDEAGRPGTILTFFPWEHAAPGRAGVGLTQATSFRVPASSIGYWAQRFIEKGVAHEALEKRFGEPALSFIDPRRHESRPGRCRGRGAGKRVEQRRHSG